MITNKIVCLYFIEIAHTGDFPSTGTRLVIVMDVLAAEVGTHQPWGLVFADHLALCAESNVEVEEELEKWRKVLEENGLK